MNGNGGFDDFNNTDFDVPDTSGHNTPGILVGSNTVVILLTSLRYVSCHSFGIPQVCQLSFFWHPSGKSVVILLASLRYVSCHSFGIPQVCQLSFFWHPSGKSVVILLASLRYVSCHSFGIP